MKILKHFLVLLVLIAYTSCQEETLSDSNTTEEAMEDEILVPVGEEDETLVFDENSEKLVAVSKNSITARGRNRDRDRDKDCIPDLDGFELNLPDAVSARTTAKPGTDSYFSLEILDSDLADTDIPAWCVDQDLSLNVEGPLNFDVYSSYEDLPEGKFEHPENFDLINWILNQSFIGQESPSGGTYNFGHIQWAIWDIIDDSNCQVCTYLSSPTGEWNNDPNNIVKAKEIVQAALDNGQDFIPQCGQKIAIVLIPENNKQSLIISAKVPELEPECDECKGKVDELTLKYKWHRNKRVKMYQKKGNTYYGVKIFDKVLRPSEEFTINGANGDGTFGKYVYIYINNCFYTKIKTNCKLKIGPGYKKGIFKVIGGSSTKGGDFCEKDYYHGY